MIKKIITFMLFSFLIFSNICVLSDNNCLTINWNASPICEVSPLAYGVNSKYFFDSSRTSNTKMMDNIKLLTSDSLLRLHSTGMLYVNSWIDSNYNWNSEKIALALKPYANRFNLMLNIANNPKGSFVKDVTDFDEWVDSYAKSAAELVEIVNVDNNYGIKYWELPNEKESLLSAANMGRLITVCSKAMKAVDPTIKVGGPAHSWISSSYIASVVQNCVDDIDFVSCHYYPGEGNTKTDAGIFGSARNVGASISSLKASVKAVSKGKKIPIFLNEYNMAYTHDNRMHTNKETVFSALTTTAALSNGAEGLNFWVAEAADMGLMDNNHNLYFTANLNILLNKYFQGDIIPTTIIDENSVVAYATKNQESINTSRYSVMLINYTGQQCPLSLDFEGAALDEIDKYQFTADGFTGPAEMGAISSGLILPEYSVTILTATVDKLNFDGPKLNVNKLVPLTDVVCSVGISANTPQMLRAKLIMVLYNADDTILLIAISDNTSPFNINQTPLSLSTSFALNDNIEGKYIKTFVWDDTETLMPILEPQEFFRSTYE